MNRHSVIAMTILVTAVGAMTARAVTADPIYGDVSASQRAEIAQWGANYWSRVEGATASTTFAFTSSVLNSDLFNPLRGPRQSLENLGLLSSSDCDKGLIEDTGLTGTAADKRQALKDALLSDKFKTDPVVNPAGTYQHVYMIMNAPAASDYIAYSEDGKLVSEKLPLDVLQAIGGNVE